MNKIIEALSVAKTAHKGQMYGGADYIVHINMVVIIALHLDYDEDIIIGCALHDTLEDTDLRYQQIADLFGKPVADMVESVTDEPGNRLVAKKKTYPKIRLSWKAIAVKLIDRTVNVLYSITTNPEKLAMYLDEHDQFVAELYNPSHPNQDAWQIYHKAIDQAKEAYHN